MRRIHNRTSRAPIALLVLVVSLGLAFFLHNLSKSKAASNSTAINSGATPAAAPPKIAPSPAVTHETPKPLVATPAPAPAPAKMEHVALVTQTPTAAPPTTKPVIEIGMGPAQPSSNKPQPIEKPAMKPSPTTASAALPPGASAEQLLKDGQAKFEAGQLLPARVSLNAAIQSGKLSATDLAAAKSSIATINQSVVFSPKRFSDDPFGGTYTVQKGDNLAKIAFDHEVTVGLLKRLNNITDERKLRAGANIKVIHGPFHAAVDKSDFTLDLYLGGAPGESASMFVTTFKVGLGKDDSTPTGVWMVEMHKKIMNPTYFSPRGEGVIEADDPKNPLGERWIGLTGIDGHAVGKASYGIHGTIDPDTIGKMESMGCIRLKNEDVEVVFDLLVEAKSTVAVKE